MKESLFVEFPPVPTEDWRSLIESDLKGADYERKLVKMSLDGLRMEPFYRAEDLPVELEGPQRGFTEEPKPFLLREEIRDLTAREANEHGHQALARGADEIAFHCFPQGTRPNNPVQMEELVRGLPLDKVPIHWYAGPLSQPILALVVSEARQRDLELSNLRGGADFDPILDRCSEWCRNGLLQWQDSFVAGIQGTAELLPNYDLLTVRGALLEKAGASLAQELAWTLAVFTEYLVAAKEAMEVGKIRIPGTSSVQDGLRELVRRTEIRFAVGTNYFLEIAKLRAARILFHTVLESFGIEQVYPKIHVVTTSSNKTLYDAENNLLRATIEAMAAVIGGMDSLSVAAFDQGYGATDEFSEHLARNTVSLLREEAHLDDVVDPLGGSYTVESLTHSFAEIAWDQFKEIERCGGFVEAWMSGHLATELAMVQARRRQQLQTRQRKIVGTTVYANSVERRLDSIGIQADSVQGRDPEMELAELVDHLNERGTLEEFLTDFPIPSSTLNRFRPSWPYEHLRLRIEEAEKSGINRPEIQLIAFGDVKMREARVDFCRNFLAPGGYCLSVTRQSELNLQEAISDRPEASIRVLCSSDDAYLAASQIISKFSERFFVAGYPKDCLNELQINGVIGFIHLKSPHETTLSGIHDLLGVPDRALTTLRDNKHETSVC